MAETAPLLTSEQVATWVAEHAEAQRRATEWAARAAELGRKIEAIRLLLPARAVEALLNPQEAPKRADASFTELVMEVLTNRERGYAPAEIRSILMADADPEVAKKVRRSGNGVSNALHRLADKEEVIKSGAKYYLPAVLARIHSGEIEVHEEELEPVSFNGRMHAAMQAHGKPFTAKDATEVAKSLSDLSGELEKQPSRVYSWLSREFGRGKLFREGALYFYDPSQRDEALSGSAASASTDTEEGATSSGVPQSTLRLIG